jgi:hypothetical protein
MLLPAAFSLPAAVCGSDGKFLDAAVHLRRFFSLVGGGIAFVAMSEKALSYVAVTPLFPARCTL